MRKLTSLLLMAAFLAPPWTCATAYGQSASGGAVRAKPQGGAQPGRTDSAPAPPRQKGRNQDKGGAQAAETEAARRRAQAVGILKDVVERAGEIQGTRSRVTVLSSALDLLWKHDETYARAAFVKSADALLEKFAAGETKGQERAEVRTALGTLLKTFARRDPRASERLLDRFQKLLEDVLKGGTGSRLTGGERLSLAQAGLESDPAQSAALAAKVIESGLPAAFPEYLNELERRDAAAAASLFRAALSILGGGSVYNPQQATVLSAYAFRESYMSVPVTETRDGAPLEFGMFATPLSPPDRDLNPARAGAYLAAAALFLSSQAAALEQRDDLDARHVGVCYFLVKKLRGYADKLGLNGGQALAVLDARFSILAERAKLGEAALSGLAASAQTIVTSNTVFRFDGGASALAAAEKTQDPAERAELLARGVRQLVDEGKYAEAVQRIPDIRDEKSRAQLTDYLHFSAAEASIRKLDWDGVNDQINRVADTRLRSYLLLTASRAASSAKKKEAASEFLHAVMASVAKIEDAEARAGTLVTTAGALYALDPAWAAQVLAEGVKAINRAERYDTGIYGVALEAPKHRVWLPLPNSDLGHCFEQAAKHDWPGSLAAAQAINSKELQSRAYIAACRAVL